MGTQVTHFYVVGPKDEGEGLYWLIAETGQVLAEHFCSASGYAHGDLWEDRPERWAAWDEQFGRWNVSSLAGATVRSWMTREGLMELNAKRAAATMAEDPA